MGSGVSSNANYSDNSDQAADRAPAMKKFNPVDREWKMQISVDQARKKFVTDGTLAKNCPVFHLELRMLLDDPIAQRELGEYAKLNKAEEMLFCWTDIQEFKAISLNAEDYRRNKALYIYQKYVKRGSVLEIGGLTMVDRETVNVHINESIEGNTAIPDDIFDLVQRTCFSDILNNIFLPFQLTRKYKLMHNIIKDRYNCVKVDDFDYIKRIGQGSFGLVVHCCKKTTGIHYAMKVQRKVALLQSYSHDLRRVDFEKHALIACSHPFIIALAYAFQTASLAIMVMELGSGGSLHDALRDSPTGCLTEERVLFYTAEIILALHHLHRLGMIYRDLKPTNVLLNADGHIKLIDLGGVVDVVGVASSASQSTDDKSDIIAPFISKETVLQVVSDINQLFFVPAPASSGTVDRNRNSRTTASTDKSVSTTVNTNTISGNMSNPFFENNSSNSMMEGSDENNSASNGTPNQRNKIQGAVSLNSIIEIDDNDPNVSKYYDCEENVGSPVNTDNTADQLANGHVPVADGSEEAANSPDSRDAIPNNNTPSAKDLSNSNSNKTGSKGRVSSGRAGTGREIFINQYRRNRALSVMGTMGYMAPEVVIMLYQTKEKKVGYTSAVDFWSLGVTIYRLLTGKKPFSVGNVSTFVAMATGLDSDAKDMTQYGILFQKIKFPFHISTQAADIISKLLDVDESKRLGAFDNFKSLLEHPFFRGMNWIKLEQKLVEPPFVPPKQYLDVSQAMERYGSFEDFITENGRERWLKDYLNEYIQSNFADWDYISPQTLKIEMGISQAMEQYDQNLKVRRLLGPLPPNINNTQRESTSNQNSAHITPRGMQ